MDRPLVTIVTPSFNQGRFIRATIESVLAQDYPRIEYIIMDGGSTDDTAKVAGDYKGRLKWISEPDRGQSHAINKGFRLANGELVAWLNSDDVYLPGAVRHAVEAFQRKPTLGAVYGEGYLIDREGQITQRFPYTQPMNLWRLVHLSDFILQQTAFFRRDIFDKIGLIDESLEYTMDWDIFIRIAAQYEIGYIKEYMGALREYAEAKSSSGGLRRVREIRQMLHKHTGLRLPPGFVVYGLDTFQSLLCDWADRRLRGIPRELVKQVVRIGCGNYIGRTIAESQGWYPDHWAGPHVHYMVPPGPKQVTIQGELPKMNGVLSGQTLEVRCNGKRILSHALEPGPFHLTFEPRPEDREGVLRLDLKASRFVIPQVMLGGSDYRRVSYILSDIAWR